MVFAAAAPHRMLSLCVPLAAYFATAIFMSLYYVRIPSGETGRKIVIGGVLCKRLELEGGNERQTAKPMTRDESYSFFVIKEVSLVHPMSLFSFLCK